MGEANGRPRVGRGMALRSRSAHGRPLDTGIDTVMHASGVYPPLGQPMATLFLLAMAYRTVDGIAGSYIASPFAPRRPTPHALTLGVLGIVVSTIGAVLTWNNGPAFGPRWYPVALIVMAIRSVQTPAHAIASTARATRSSVGILHPFCRSNPAREAYIANPISNAAMKITDRRWPANLAEENAAR